MKPFFALLLLFVLSLPTSVRAENLLEILELAIKHDATYQAAKFKARSVDEKVVQARAALLPSVGATYSFSESDGESLQFEQDGIAPPQQVVRESLSETTNLNVSLNQVIYNHRNYENLSIAKKLVQQESYALQFELQNLIIRAAEAYLNVLSAEDEVTFKKAESKAIGQQLEQTKQRYNVGLIAITDVHQAQADFDRAKADRIVSQNTLDNRREALRQITGRYHQKLQSLGKSLKLEKPKPDSVDRWVEIAKENNIGIKRQQIAVSIARDQIGVEQAGHYPTLSFNASYSDSETVLPDIPGSFGNSSFNGTTLGLTLNVPLFSGFATHSKTREQRYLFQEASQNLELAHREAQRNTRSAYLGVIAGISSVRAFSQALVSNESALEATQAGFEVGTKTIVDVLLATRGLFQAKSQLSRAKYDYMLNVLRLRQAAGVLKREDIVELNSWLKKG